MASEGDASGLSSKTPLLASHEHGSLGLEDDHARRANRMQCLTTTAPGRKAGFDRVFLRRLGLLVRVGFNHSCCSRMAWRAYLNWVLTLIAALLMFSTKLVIGPFIQAIVEVRGVLLRRCLFCLPTDSSCWLTTGGHGRGLEVDGHWVRRVHAVHLAHCVQPMDRRKG